jgi:hypothetical protein
MTTWLRRKCLNCRQVSEVMRFKTGICEDQQHCPHCGSDQGEDLPMEASEEDRYLCAPPLAQQVSKADRTIVLTEAAAYLVREAQRRFGSPLRLSVKSLFLESMKWGFEALDQARALDRQRPKPSKPKKRSARRGRG